MRRTALPYRPQDQSKIECFDPQEVAHCWSPTQNLPELNNDPQAFARIYNTERPHRPLNRQTRASAYTTTDKAISATAESGKTQWTVPRKSACATPRNSSATSASDAPQRHPRRPDHPG
ncbi:integrase core domain-containing protein [Arthrobacter sp. NPDC090010]|uniref:integrase core domain-containing protein n=1 Tax=Arthrobacter sp. NPDC090010 TaxID=3363942 RepID=UPI0037F6CD5F